jgi:hypothetical protein
MMISFRNDYRVCGYYRVLSQVRNGVSQRFWIVPEGTESHVAPNAQKSSNGPCFMGVVDSHCESRLIAYIATTQLITNHLVVLLKRKSVEVLYGSASYFGGIFPLPFASLVVIADFAYSRKSSLLIAFVKFVKRFSSPAFAAYVSDDCARFGLWHSALLVGGLLPAAALLITTRWPF